MSSLSFVSRRELYQLVIWKLPVMEKPMDRVKSLCYIISCDRTHCLYRLSQSLFNPLSKHPPKTQLPPRLY